jgi:hypothetical protein
MLSVIGREEPVTTDQHEENEIRDWCGETNLARHSATLVNGLMRHDILGYPH